MNLISWIKKTLITSGPHHHLSKAEIKYLSDKSGTTSSHLDLKGAIDAHTEWTLRLRVFLMGGKDAGTIDPDIARNDRNCTLGQWLNDGAKRQFYDKVEYLTLLKSHREFHACAGAIVSLKLLGDVINANKMFRDELNIFSSRVQIDLVRFYAKIG